MTRYSEYVRRYTGDLQVGDIVKRTIRDAQDLSLQQTNGEYGIVVDRFMAGNPIHPCVDVMWGNSKGAASIGECYLQRVSEVEDGNR